MPQPNGVNIARIDAGMDNCLLCRRRDKAFNRIPGQLPKCGMSPANDICLNLDLGHLQPRIVLGMGSLGSGEWADHPNHCRWKLPARSEEHTSELQSLMRTSYAVFCLKKKTIKTR